MEILGIGPLELGFIIIIALIVLGPKDMAKAGRTIGRTLRKIITSPTWKSVRAAGQGLQELPNRLIREAGMEEELQAISTEIQDTANSIDPRRISRSFSETFKLDAPDSPPPVPRLETDAPSGQNPAPETPPENPQA